MPNTDAAFGIDLSRWNTSADGKTKVDFDVIADHVPHVSFIAMRAGVSWGYQDPWFAYYMAEAERIHRFRLAYHVLYPGEDPTRQMDNFFRILGDVDLSQLPLVLDLELDHGQTNRRITDTTADSVNIIIKRTGRKPIIYSRANWVNQFLIVSQLPPVYWWLAQYRWPLPYPLYTTEYPSPPLVPAGVTDWLIHQTANRGKSIGAKALYYMDYNRFNGTHDAVVKFGGVSNTHLLCPIDGKPCPRLYV
jgi:lysozyme